MPGPKNNLKNAMAKRYAEGPAVLPLTDLRTGDLFGPDVKQEVIASPNIGEDGKAFMKQPPKPVEQVKKLTGGASLSGEAPRYSAHEPLEQARQAVSALPKPQPKRKTPEELMKEADAMIASMKAQEAVSQAYVGGPPRMPSPAPPGGPQAAYKVQQLPMAAVQADALKRPVTAQETASPKGSGMQASKAPVSIPLSNEVGGGYTVTDEELKKVRHPAPLKAPSFIPQSAMTAADNGLRRLAPKVASVGQPIARKIEKLEGPAVTKWFNDLREKSSNATMQDEVDQNPGEAKIAMRDWANTNLRLQDPEVARFHQANRALDQINHSQALQEIEDMKRKVKK